MGQQAITVMPAASAVLYYELYYKDIKRKIVIIVIIFRSTLQLQVPVLVVVSFHSEIFSGLGLTDGGQKK